VLQKKPLEAYKDSSNNLGLNSYFFSEPAVPEKAKVTATLVTQLCPCICMCAYNYYVTIHAIEECIQTATDCNQCYTMSAYSVLVH
jgi:hypothetical protein